MNVSLLFNREPADLLYFPKFSFGFGSDYWGENFSKREIHDGKEMFLKRQRTCV